VFTVIVTILNSFVCNLSKIYLFYRQVDKGWYLQTLDYHSVPTRDKLSPGTGSVIRKITVQSQPRQIVHETLSQKYPTPKKGWLCGSSGRVPTSQA
jgi:hypothetical protein